MSRDPEFQKQITALNIKNAATVICTGIKECEGSPYGWIGSFWVEAALRKAVEKGYIIIPENETVPPERKL